MRAVVRQPTLLVVGLVGRERISIGTHAHSGLGGAAVYASLAAEEEGLRPVIVTIGAEEAKRNLSSFSPRSAVEIVGPEGSSPTFNISYDSHLDMVQFSYDQGSWASRTSITKLLETIDQALDETVAVHLCPLPSEIYPRLLEVVETCKSLSTQLHFAEIDQSRRALTQLLTASKLVFMNRLEAMMLTGSSDWANGRDRVTQFVPDGLVAVTHPAGVEVGSGADWTKWDVPKGQPVDPTGGGDSFAGGFIAGHLSGQSIHSCVVAGLRQAQKAVAGYSSSR